MSIDRASGFAPASAGGRSGGRLGLGGLVGFSVGGRSGGRLGFGGLVGFSVGGRSAGRLGLGGFVRSGRGGPSYSGLCSVFCRRSLRRPMLFAGPVPSRVGPRRALLQRVVVGGFAPAFL